MTLIELMVAVGFLAVGAIALLTCVNTSLIHQAYAQRRARLLASAENAIDTVRSNASFGTISTGVTTSSLDGTGLQSHPTLTTTITLQSPYTDLYLVDVTVSWNEHPESGVTRADFIELDTFVRPNDT